MKMNGKKKRKKENPTTKYLSPLFMVDLQMTSLKLKFPLTFVKNNLKILITSNIIR